MIGKNISHYEILEKLGSGGMGVVYKARDLKLDRIVAIKFMAHSVPTEQKSRFIGEAKAASTLDHPNICTVYELGETEEGNLFIAMAYCPGQNLHEKLRRGPLPVEDAVNFAVQIAEALAKAHSRGVLHRDIKPANVMITPEGVVKVVDFGLARLPQDPHLTRPGAIVGTVPYMSPEQLKGEEVDHRSDIWSWGLVTYEMVVGKHPFLGPSDLATGQAILSKEPEPLSGSRAEVSFELDRIVAQALSKRAEDRQASAEDLLRSLRSLDATTASGTRFTAPISCSVLVLPFSNLSAEPDNEYFSDGLAEDLIHALSSIPNLRVVSRISAFEFKGKPQEIRKIGQQLRVSTIVEGSVRKLGERLRISVQLVNVSDGYCLWSQRFDRQSKDVFEIQDEIAQTVAERLKLQPGEDTSQALRQRRPENVEAYDHYLRGRFHLNKPGGEGMQRALECFELALAKDPNYARAYSGIADHHVTVASWGLEPPVVAWPKAKAAASRALEIDDGLAEAHASMGTIRMWYEWNWKEAEQHFQRAIQLNPGYPNAHIQYNLLLVHTGRFDEAENEVRAALRSDPLSVRANSYLAGVFHYRREYDRSLKQCHRALELDPNDIELRVVLGLNYEQQGRYAQAIAELEKACELSGNNPLIWGPLGSCYAASGQTAEARKLLDQLDQVSPQGYVAPITWVMIYLSLREYDLAFEWLDKAAEAREALLCYLGVGPIYDCIAADPRYRELLQRIGLAATASSQALTI